MDRRRFLRSSVGAVLGAVAAGCAASGPRGSGPAPGGAFVALFPNDGPPQGWRVSDWSNVAKPPPQGAAWTVTDGILRCSTRGTWLVSEAVYGDFVLELDFRLGEKGNGGVGLRFPDAGDPAYDGLELQIVDPRYYGGRGEPDQLAGAFYKGVAPKTQVFKPGEWNHYEIALRGPRVKVILNGETIQDFNLDDHANALERGTSLKDRPRRGHIGLQELSAGGSHVEYRHVRIKVL
jgi:hypothetical protein